MKVELSSKELSIIILALKADITTDEVIQMSDPVKKDLLKRLEQLSNKIN